MAPAGGCVHRLPVVTVFHVSADVLVQQELYHSQVTVGGCYMQLIKNKRLSSTLAMNLFFFYWKT